MFYFLKKDFDALNEEIQSIAEKIKEIGQEMGRSCQEGADTFHDNFAHEEGERQQYMWSKRIGELIRMRNQAVVTTPRKMDSVTFGCVVTIENENTKNVSTFKISSYMVLRKSEEMEEISYNAPLARILICGKVGEIREGEISEKNERYKILKIE